MSTPSNAPYGLRLDRTAYEEYGNRPRDLIAEVDSSASGNTVLRVGRENEPGGSWRQTAHVVLTPEEAWLFAAEVADAQPPEGVAKLAREVVEMWRAGPRMHDPEEFDAAMSALANALPPRHQPPVEYREGDVF